MTKGQVSAQTQIRMAVPAPLHDESPQPEAQGFGLAGEAHAVFFGPHHLQKEGYEFVLS